MAHDPTIHAYPEPLRLRPGGKRRRPGPDSAAVPGPALDAIVLPIQTAEPVAHPPKGYGNWRGVYNRLRMWALDGTTWERVCTALMTQPDADEDLVWASSGLGPLVIEDVVDEGDGPWCGFAHRRTGHACSCTRQRRLVGGVRTGQRSVIGTIPRLPGGTSIT
ncbi:transposase [Streptomyces sp. NPDC057684]|uniref:transposase n=1 Tax=Streptomyces sp. NPDC057684 TaxID=3346211 RepID=UPI0036981C7F